MIQKLMPVVGEFLFADGFLHAGVIVGSPTKSEYTQAKNLNHDHVLTKHEMTCLYIMS